MIFRVKDLQSERFEQPSPADPAGQEGADQSSSAAPGWRLPESRGYFSPPGQRTIPAGRRLPV